MAADMPVVSAYIHVDLSLSHILFRSNDPCLQAKEIQKTYDVLIAIMEEYQGFSFAKWCEQVAATSEDKLNQPLLQVRGGFNGWWAVQYFEVGFALQEGVWPMPGIQKRWTK